MEIITSIVSALPIILRLHSPAIQVLQAALLGLALVITSLRTWIRLYTEHRRLTLADYLVWGGWVCVVGWVACSIRALYLQVDDPLDEDAKSDSEIYLKVCEQYPNICIRNM